jgi:protein-S-isoprenylcysteine O-methyltransferase Ste14
MATQVGDRPGVIAPPPLIYLAFLIVGLGLNRVTPLPIHPAVRVVGGALVALGIGLLVFAVRTMRRAHTHVSPYKPTIVILSSGPYGFSRNPIYVAFAITYVGVAFCANTMWPLLLLPILVLFISVFVITREERYLEGKFGAPYVAYKSRVRRWV